VPYHSHPTYPRMKRLGQRRSSRCHKLNHQFSFSAAVSLRKLIWSTLKASIMHDDPRTGCACPHANAPWRSHLMEPAYPVTMYAFLLKSLLMRRDTSPMSPFLGGARFLSLSDETSSSYSDLPTPAIRRPSVSTETMPFTIDPCARLVIRRERV